MFAAHCMIPFCDWLFRGVEYVSAHPVKASLTVFISLLILLIINFAVNTLDRAIKNVQKKRAERWAKLKKGATITFEQGFYDVSTPEWVIVDIDEPNKIIYLRLKSDSYYRKVVDLKVIRILEIATISEPYSEFKLGQLWKTRDGGVVKLEWTNEGAFVGTNGVYYYSPFHIHSNKDLVKQFTPPEDGNSEDDALREAVWKLKAEFDASLADVKRKQKAASNAYKKHKKLEKRMKALKKI